MTNTNWSAAAEPGNDDGETYKRQYSWQQGRNQFDYTVEIPENLLKYYQNRTRTTAYGSYAIDPFHEPILSSIVDYLKGATQSWGENERELFEAVARFVQSITYEKDAVTNDRPEYPQFPVETLYYNQGDCEDLTILAAAILWECDFDVAAVTFPNKQHMCLGVAVPWDGNGGVVTHEGTNYSILETTDPGWDLGEIPPQYRNAAAAVYPMKDTPLLLHQWGATPHQSGVDIDGHIANFGTGDATDVKVTSVFERREGQYGRLRTVTAEDIIPPGKHRSFSGTLPQQRSNDVRVRVQVRVGSQLHDQTVSDWG